MASAADFESEDVGSIPSAPAIKCLLLLDIQLKGCRGKKHGFPKWDSSLIGRARVFRTRLGRDGNCKVSKVLFVGGSGPSYPTIMIRPDGATGETQAT